MNQRVRILIVDDTEESLKLLSDILCSEGYDVRPADSGELALAAVTACPPDLILLDMCMPGMRGLEICKRIKSHPETRDIPVIFVSASQDFEDRLESLDSGAVDFLSKPFRREELVARIRTHLELARLRKDLERQVAERTASLQIANDQLRNELEVRRRMEEDLRESENRFRSIADTAPAGICLFDPEGLPIYANKWLLAFLGTDHFGPGNLWNFVHPEDLTRLTEEISKSVRERSPSQIEHRLLRHDGAYRWVAVTANPRYVHGEFAGHTIILLDITELKRSQEVTLAAQKMESLGVLTAGVAHDFNNLLSSILANSDLVLEDLPVDSPHRESLSDIYTVALRGAGVVKLLMSYAGSMGAASFEPIDPSPLIQEMVKLLQLTIPANTSLRVNLSNVPPVWADDSQFRQVLLNLIMNASEALETRPGTVTVSTSHSRVNGAADPGHPDLKEGEYVLIEVSDTGTGMTQNTKGKIFDPFFSTKFLGRGLGLASVQGIVRDSGGALDVISIPGLGSTFKVWLPCSGQRTKSVKSSLNDAFSR